MKRIALTIIATLAITSLGQAQTDSLSNVTTSISKGLNVFVFPKDNQSPQQQELDEYNCYKWAVQQTGYNPINPPEVQAEQVQTGPDGTAVRGAARGAAAGAAIGSISGNAGDGAAYGAIIGGIRGRRARKRGQATEQVINDVSADQANAQMLADFKRAFSTCLQAKNYQVQ